MQHIVAEPWIIRMIIRSGFADLGCCIRARMHGKAAARRAVPKDCPNTMAVAIPETPEKNAETFDWKVLRKIWKAAVLIAHQQHVFSPVWNAVLTNLDLNSVQVNIFCPKLLLFF